MDPYQRIRDLGKKSKSKPSFVSQLKNIKSVERGGTMVTTGQLVVAPGVVFFLRTLVDLRNVEKGIRSGRISGGAVEGIFGDIWKGVKKVGKAIGIKKIVKVAKGILKNPIVQAAFPEARAGAAGLECADMLATAALAKKKGRPEATRIMAIAAVTAKKAGLDKPAQAQQITNQASRLYKIMVTPA